MYPINTFGSEAQKEKYLPKMVKGELIGCFGLTEPDHGSDPSGMETKAVPDGNGWVINGAKMWITNGSVADLCIVWAKTPDGVRGFVVDTDTRGFSARKIEKKLSMRASVTSELHFDDMRVPASAMLPGTRGVGSALSCLNEARFGIAWGVIGSAMACFESALEYAKIRPQFGKPIAAFQLVQDLLVKMLANVTASTAMNTRASQLQDAGLLRDEHASLCKAHSTVRMRETVGWAREVLGGNGILLEHHVGRFVADAEAIYSYEGTREMNTLIVGRAITGKGAFV
jgi:glutaryl-CoA dehydrogenase